MMEAHDIAWPPDERRTTSGRTTSGCWPCCPRPWVRSSSSEHARPDSRWLPPRRWTLPWEFALSTSGVLPRLYPHSYPVAPRNCSQMAGFHSDARAARPGNPRVSSGQQRHDFRVAHRSWATSRDHVARTLRVLLAEGLVEPNPTVGDWRCGGSQDQRR
jgi:hypothetical protein